MDDTVTHEEPVYEQFKDKNTFIQYLTPRIMSNGEKAEADIGHRLSQHELTIPYTSDLASKNKAEVDVNMLERDPNHVNEDVRVGFEEVFAEPNGMHSFDMVWEYSFLTFSSSKLWCYKIITAFCSLPFSLCWGIQFACLTFCHIWYVTPCLKMWHIILDWVGKIWSNCIRTFADPLFESAGRVLGNIRITTRTE